jgi:hypothetical protein
MPKANPKLPDTPNPLSDQAKLKPKRNARGQIMPGYSGNPSGPDPSRMRRELNAMTVKGFADAFRRGGQAAIDKVMKQQPAHFVKMLVLLVPRELEVMHSQGVKAMTDQQIEDAIAAIKGMLEERMVDVTPAKPKAKRVPGPTEADGSSADKP